MPNEILTPKQAAQGLLKICRQQIKEMEQDGLSKDQIQSVMNIVFSGFMHSPFWEGHGN